MALSDDVQKEIEALENHLSEPAFTDADILDGERLLRNAYRSTILASSSSSDFFAGTYRTENKKFADGKLPEYLIDPNRPNERRDRWATQTHAGQQTTAYFSKPPTGTDQYVYGWVHGIVNQLPERNLVFIKGEFMQQGRARGEFLARSLEQFWRDYQTELTPSALRAVVYVFAQTIITMQGGRDPLVLAIIRKNIDAKKSNWHKNYMPHWRALRVRYEQLRRESVCAFLVAEDSDLTSADNLSTISGIKR